MSFSGLGGGAGKLSAVDAILAEAADLVALEQIAKLNTAHLTDDSALPSTLESRFRKLKSLPAAPAAAPVKTLGRSVTAPRATPLPLDPPHATPLSHDPSPRPNPTPQQPPAPPIPAVQEPQQRPGPEDTAGKKEKSPPPPQQARDDEDPERLFWPAGGRGRPTLRERNRGSRDDDHDSSASPPPRQACCFGFSPKKPLQRTPPTKKKGKEEGGVDVLGIDADDWADENGRMVTELREQQRKLKKALQEQVKVSRETAKMARWVKQASARMTHTAAIDDLLSDCDDDDDFK